MSSSARAITLAVALVAIGCGSNPAPTPSPSPLSSPAPSLPQLADWQEVTLPSDDETVGYGTAVATPTGFVAAGYGRRPAAWSSTDGETWVEESIAGDSRNPTDAIAWGDRVLLFGGGEFGPGCAHPQALDTWVRDEAGAWTHAPFQDAFCEGGTASAAVSPGLAVIVGASSGDSPYAWNSVDGLHWVEHADAFPPDRLPYGLIATSTGFFAIGTSPSRAWIARSADGAAWTEPLELPGPAGSRPLGAAVVGRALIVMLAGADGSVAVASSADGEVWTAESVAGITADELLRVEAMPDGLVALGGDEQGPALWVSADGRSWRRVEMPETGQGGYLTDVAVGLGRVVVLGGAETGGGGLQPAAWVGPAELLAP